MKPILALTLFTFLVFAHSAQPTIDKFVKDRSVTPLNTDIISPLSGDKIHPIQPSEVKPGSFCFREKLGTDKYGLYSGKPKKGAYATLYCFKLKGYGFSDNVKMKFYPKDTSSNLGDIRDVYLEGELIFFTDRSEIYYHKNGKMTKLNALSVKPARLLVTSTPSGATVLINNSLQGPTPLSLGGIFDLGMLVHLEKNGYYPQEDFVDFKGGQELTKNFTLLPLYQPDVGTLDLAAITAKNTDNPEEIEARISRLNKEYERLKILGDLKQRAIPPKFPGLSKKGKFEKLIDYEKRTNNYNDGIQKAMGDISITNRKLIYVPFQKAIHSLELYLKEMEAKVHTKKLPISSLTPRKYDSETQTFPLTIQVKDEPFEFSFHGALRVPIKIAQSLKTNKNAASLSIDYNKKFFDVYIKGQKEKRCVSLKGLVLQYKGKRYNLNGEFKYPPFITYNTTIKKFETVDSMVKLPGGCFDMGSDGKDVIERRDMKEWPVHHVCLDEFWMGKYEVTVGEYLACVRAGVCKTPEWLEEGSKYNIHNGKDEKYKKSGVSERNTGLPVTGVNWSDASAYCKWRGRRLPTEAEWEYAARAGTKTPFYTGDCISSEQANYTGQNTKKECRNGEDRNKIVEVGQFTPNPWGLYDMSGNVWEWVNDWYKKIYYFSSPKENPQGPTEGRYRIFRGGSWTNKDNSLRSASRVPVTADHRSYVTGFRCAR